MKTIISRIRMYYGADSNTLRAAQILRRSMTKSEAVLWKKLRDR
jgi:very-short-patch-repair endonuclease